jgi:hypothetical protein
LAYHWRLALWYALFVALGAVVIGTLIYVYYAGAQAGAFGYGAGVGLLSFISTAATVSLLTGRSALWRAVGAGSFVARYGFVVAALGIPAYLGLWPVVPMVAGFAGVYLAENFMLLPGALKVISGSEAGRERKKEAERRVTA